MIVALVAASAAIEMYGHGPAPVVKYPERPGATARLCGSVEPWFNKRVRGHPMPFSVVVEHQGLHMWAWRRGGQHCLIKMVDL